MTNLPSTNEAFESGQSQDSIALSDALTADGATELSSTAAVALVACLFGRTLTHLHRVEPGDQPGDAVNGGFWKRQRKLDAVMTNTLLYLPDRLRASFGGKQPNVLFLNVTIHAAIICVHQAAVRQAEEHDCGDEIIRSSATRAYNAAEEIVNIMKLVSHVDSANVNIPTLPVCAVTDQGKDEPLPLLLPVRGCADLQSRSQEVTGRRGHSDQSRLLAEYNASSQAQEPSDGIFPHPTAGGAGSSWSTKSFGQFEAAAFALQTTSGWF